jgi:hypothetical protein
MINFDQVTNQTLKGVEQQERKKYGAIILCKHMYDEKLFKQ